MPYEQFKKLDGKKHDRRIKAVIGISLSKFNILLVAFTAAYDSVQMERCQKGEIKNVSKGGLKEGGLRRKEIRRLACINGGTPAASVRHPANGGAAAFSAGIESLLSSLRTFKNL